MDDEVEDEDNKGSNEEGDDEEEEEGDGEEKQAHQINSNEKWTVILEGLSQNFITHIQMNEFIDSITNNNKVLIKDNQENKYYTLQYYQEEVRPKLDSKAKQ